MIIYNITFKVDWSIHAEWHEWVREIFMPGMLATELFYHGQLVKLLDLDETDGPTYALQFNARTLEDYQLFIRDPQWMPLRRQQNRWNDAAVSFGSVMQVVQ